MKKRLKKKRAKRNWYYAAKIMSLIFHRPIEIYIGHKPLSRHKAKAWWGMCKLMGGRRIHNFIFDEYFTDGMFSDAVIVNPNDIACSGYTPNEYGKWECTEISENGSVYLCTNCGKSIITNEDINTVEVCPYCGAEMFVKED